MTEETRVMLTHTLALCPSSKSKFKAGIPRSTKAYNVVASTHGTRHLKFPDLVAIVTPAKSLMGAILGLSLTTSALALVQPWLAGRLAESLTGQPEGWINDVYRWLLAWFAVVAVYSLVLFLSNRLSASVAESMFARLRNRAFEHIQSLPLTWHQRRKTGDTLSLLTHDTGTISTFVSTTVIGLIPSVLVLFGALIAMFRISPKFTVLAAAFIPVYYLAIKIVGRRLRPVSRKLLDAWSEKTVFLQDHLQLLPVIKAFGQEAREISRHEACDRKLSDAARRQAFLGARIAPLTRFLAAGGLLFLMWVGVTDLERGALDTAQLVSLLFYVLLLNQPVAALAGSYGKIQSTLGAAERLQTLFGSEPEPDPSQGEELKIKSGTVRFENVRFTYPNAPPLFEGLCLEVPGGRVTLLTGPNGVGKSTLIHLAMRFLRPSVGKIAIDGQSLEDVSTHSLRDAVGLVAQHTVLLNTTIADNLRYGKWQATQNEMETACEAAGAMAFIRELPDGLETVIGEQGLHLSGGQRQRISLARTLLKDPPIVLIDEATSMIDEGGLDEFIERIPKLFAGKTVLLVSHQKQYATIAQHVIHLESGSQPSGEWPQAPGDIERLAAP